MKFIVGILLSAFVLFSIPNFALADVWVNGYYRSNGTYVDGHYRSDPDGNPYNNWSYPGNTNPYTGETAGGSPSSYLDNHFNNSSSIGSYRSRSASSGSFGSSFYNPPSTTTYTTPSYTVPTYVNTYEEEKELIDAFDDYYDEYYKAINKNSQNIYNVYPKFPECEGEYDKYELITEKMINVSESYYNDDYDDYDDLLGQVSTTSKKLDNYWDDASSATARFYDCVKDIEEIEASKKTIVADNDGEDLYVSTQDKKAEAISMILELKATGEPITIDDLMPILIMLRS